jgi:hypothetical protein
MAMNTIAKPLDRQTTGGVLFWTAVAKCIHVLLPTFYLGAFLPLVPVDNVKYFLGGKGMFLCFYVFTNCACGHTDNLISLFLQFDAWGWGNSIPEAMHLE